MLIRRQMNLLALVSGGSQSARTAGVTTQSARALDGLADKRALLRRSL